MEYWNGLTKNYRSEYKQNKYNCSGSLVFESQRYRVRLEVKTKIITSLAACKKSARFIISFLKYSRF